MGFSRFNSLRFAELSFFLFTNLSQSSHKISLLQLLQFLILCGIKTP